MSTTVFCGSLGWRISASRHCCRLLFGEAQGQEVKMWNHRWDPLWNRLETPWNTVNITPKIETPNKKLYDLYDCFWKETLNKFLGSVLSSSMFHMFHCSQRQGYCGPPAQVMWPFTLLEYGGAQRGNHRRTHSVAEPACRWAHRITESYSRSSADQVVQFANSWNVFCLKHSAWMVRAIINLAPKMAIPSVMRS